MADETYSQRLRLLARYRNGTIGYGVEDNNKFTINYRDSRISPYFGDLEDRGLVIDAESIMRHKDFTSWVILDPMVNPQLSGWEYKKYIFASVVHILYPDKEVKADICDLAKEPLHDKQFGTLDEVSPILMANIWELRGAKIGIRRGDEIHWLNSTRTIIPTFSNRFENAF